MKGHKFQTYIYWGVTAFFVIAACILVALAVIKWDVVREGIRFVNGILAPVTYGIILAYLISPVYNRLKKWTEKGLGKAVRSPKRRAGLAKCAATAGSLAAICLVIVGLFSMIIPTVWESIMGIINSVPAFAQKIYEWIEEVFANNPEVEEAALNAYNQAVDRLLAWTRTTANWMPDLKLVFSQAFSGVMGVVVLTKNILIGFIVMIYLLNLKDTLLAQAKKIAYGLFPLGFANGLVEKFRFVHKVFGGFITGKLIDSLIIGGLTFVVLSLLKMPYTMLISVIVGVTNVIPFFGPFIGAVPSAILLLLVSPKQCLIFLICILLIQQFDGNILGPKILGNSTGLSSFWVLFSILFFGGILGPVGMIIGVPTFAVIYRLLSEFIEDRLKKKALPTATDEYKDFDHIDGEKKTIVRQGGF